MQPSITVTATPVSRFASIILFIFLGMCAQYASAQPNFMWAKQYVSEQVSLSKTNRAHSINLDKQGNIYIGGIFAGDVDFDPGPGTYKLTAVPSTGFVSKSDASGNLLWAVGFFGSNSACIVYNAVPDKDGNVLLTGQFSGTIDFDPGSGTYNLTTPGSSLDIFICKLDADGKFIWCKQIGGAGHEAGNNLALDDAGNIYVTGFFYYTVDFDPGPAVNNLTSLGTSAAFVLKLNSSGNFVWAKAMIDPDPPYTGSNGYSIALDKSGNVYTTGNTSNQCDFDPGPGTFFLAEGGTFISKLDNDGNFVWAKGIGGVSNGTVNTGHHFINIDKDNNVLVTGNFSGTIDFDPGTAYFNITAAGLYDMFIVKLKNDGDLLWAKSMGGDSAYTIPYAVVSDNSGNVYTSGIFSSTVDFDPGSGTYNLTCGGNFDMFINVLDASGNFVCGGRVGGSDPSADLCYGYCITVDATKNIFVTGSFNGTVDFDPGSGSNTLSTGDISQCFFGKYGECSLSLLPEARFAASDTMFCNPKCINFSDNSKNATTWNWSFPGASPSSSADQNPQNICYNSPGKYTVTLIVSNGTDKDTLKKINYIESSLPVVASVSITASDISICSGTSVTFSAAPVNGGASPSYQWKVNGNNTGSDSTVFTTGTLNNKDSVTVTMTSSEGCVSGSPATSNSIVMSVSPLQQAGVISAVRDTICSGTPANLSVNGNSGNIQWQSSTDNSVFTDIPNAQSASLFDFPLTNTYYRVYTGSGMCDDTSASQKIVVNPSPVADFSYAVTGSNGREVTFNSDNSQDATAFDWDFGDGNKSTIGNPVHLFTKDSLFHVCLTVTNGSNCSFTVCRDVDLVTGISDVTKKSGWLIYPVPFDNQLFISSTSGNKEIKSVELTDVLGRTVFVRSFNKSFDTSLTIELPHLAAGMYLVKVLTTEGYFVQPVIKR